MSYYTYNKFIIHICVRFYWLYRKFTILQLFCLYIFLYFNSFIVHARIYWLTLQSERAVVYQIVVELFYGVENKCLQPVVAYIQIEEGENTGEESGWESGQPVVAEIYRFQEAQTVEGPVRDELDEIVIQD